MPFLLTLYIVYPTCSLQQQLRCEALAAKTTADTPVKAATKLLGSVTSASQTHHGPWIKKKSGHNTAKKVIYCPVPVYLANLYIFQVHFGVLLGARGPKKTRSTKSSCLSNMSSPAEVSTHQTVSRPAVWQSYVRGPGGKKMPK